MFLQLLKEIPQMFVIATILWGIVLVLAVRNSRKKEKSFWVRHRNTWLAVLMALVLTAADIWLFVFYIPTHFKKQTAEPVAVSAADLLAEPVVKDSTAMVVTGKQPKDSTSPAKTQEKKPVEKIYTTNKASIRFYSRGDAEDIEATNHSVACTLNEKTGEIRFMGLIKGFEFENEMMQNHFNDADYMNSAVYPQTRFTGKLTNIGSVDFTNNGNYPVTADGALTIRGVTKNIKATGTLTVSGKQLSLKSVFRIKRLDFGVNTDEIAAELEITVQGILQ